MKTDLRVMESLKRKHHDIVIEEEPQMAKYTSFRAGGTAKALVFADTDQELSDALKLVSENGIPHIILGNGSNTLFTDDGYDGIVIKLGKEFEKITFEGSRVNCGCSILLSVLARELLNHQLTGFEFASGIPGSLGGAVFMNAGAYGGEIKDVVKAVRVMSPDGKEIKVLSNEDMDFSYRHSALQKSGYIALDAEMEFSKGNFDDIRNTMMELANKRNTKQPVNYPSAGSTFKRPEGYFAGKLIEDAGLRGISVGGAEVSTLHSGFVINKDNATATDILQLISLIQNTVYDKFGVMLEPEVRIIGK